MQLPLRSANSATRGELLHDRLHQSDLGRAVCLKVNTDWNTEYIKYEVDVILLLFLFCFYFIIKCDAKGKVLSHLCCRRLPDS